MTELPASKSTLPDLAGFNDVWKRVMGETDRFSDTSTLQQFIQQESTLSCLYTFLARMFSGSDRTLLSGQAADNRAHIRRLRAEYFIHTANTYAPAPCQKTQGDRLVLLRHTIILERALTQAYSKAADQTAVPELSPLYRSFAAKTQTRAQNDHTLLVASF